MKLIDIIMMSVNGIRERKTRFALNLLGIMIGIAAMTALISLTMGMNSQITSQLESFGPTTITVTTGGPPGGFSPPGASGVEDIGGTGGALTLRDVDLAERLPNVALATPIISKTAEIRISGFSDYATILGIVPEGYLQIFQNIELAEGRFLLRSDSASVVLGALIAHPSNLEDPIAHIGSRITISTIIEGEEKTLSLKVAGILTEVGGMVSSDEQVFVILSTAQRLFETGNTVNSIYLKAENKESVDLVVEDVKDKLGEDILVISSGFVLDTIGSITNTISIVLGGVAGISLVVAGIGIINTTIIAVLERTREIGVMMAIGAKREEILFMFLTESALTGLIGGTIGVSFGAVLSQLTSFIATSILNVPLPSGLSLEIVLLGVGFAVLTGTLAGIYPARKASKLRPVEALRYE